MTGGTEKPKRLYAGRRSRGGSADQPFGGIGGRHSAERHAYLLSNIIISTPSPGSAVANSRIIELAKEIGLGGISDISRDCALVFTSVKDDDDGKRLVEDYLYYSDAEDSKMSSQRPLQVRL
ncbi:MAG: hypothetical protein ACLT29_05080 [Ruminococcus callidus]